MMIRKQHVFNILLYMMVFSVLMLTNYVFAAS